MGELIGIETRQRLIRPKPIIVPKSGLCTFDLAYFYNDAWRRGTVEASDFDAAERWLAAIKESLVLICQEDGA